jgi:thymidylate kinase
VVCDRWFYSSFVYQGLDGEAQGDWVKAVNEPFPHPDLLIYCRIPALELPVIQARLTQRGETPERYENLRDLAAGARRYEEVMAEAQAHTHVLQVDARARINAIAEKVWAAFTALRRLEHLPEDLY